MSTADGAHPSPGVLAELTGTLAAARAAATRFLDLASLEARRAGLALVWMIALGLAAAICAISAWLGLMAAFVLWAVSLGHSPLAAVLVLAVLNLAAGAALVYGCVGMSRGLLFPATRRRIAGAPSDPPSE